MNSDLPRDDSRCPEGRDEREIAAYAAGNLDPVASESVRIHATKCDVCAAALLGHAALAGISGIRVAQPARPASRPSVGLRRAAAAAIALAAIGGAAFAVRLAMRPAATAIGSATTLREFRAMTRARTDLIGIPDTARVVGTHSFTGPDGRPASLLLLRTDPAEVDRIAAFDANGDVLWHTGQGGFAGWDVVRVTGLAMPLRVRILRTGSADAPRSECGVAMAVHAARRSAAVFFDPATGRIRNVLWHLGRLAAVEPGAPVESESPLVIPDANGRRAVAFAGDCTVDGVAAPCVVVADPDGRLRQRILLPTLAATRSRPATATGLRVLWPREPGGTDAAIDVFTSEETDWRFPLGAGRLDAGAGIASWTDAFGGWYDSVSGPGASKARDLEPGGWEAVRTGLPRQVREDSTPFEPLWERRE